MCASETQVLVFDNGSRTSRVGFAGEDAPKVAFPSIVGKFRHNMLVGIDLHAKDILVGEEARSKRGLYVISHPIEEGTVTNWDDMEKVIIHTVWHVSHQPRFQDEFRF